MEIADKLPQQFAKFHGAISKYRAAVVPDRHLATDEPAFILEIVGPTGTRKTSSVLEAFPGAAVLTSEDGWADGYKGNEVGSMRTAVLGSHGCDR